ncbi:hypothetical protein AYL99_01331 [Fonsecaea erecta]|uniref:OTU domain-containing protein n=1 Tax=Fonsecaea erecta TaxID=1367422 RepID=A0A179A002_9EURO|nr:hypothetical protein AYL99_01331 [Fonsecaea erecta]OAP65359.1 hypothetical protein AYL99_01331 [Fonsecaea erecta]
MEELLAKHRKEKRDLQARITQKKKNATKKTRKGVNDECERLERELAEKQQAEIQDLDPQDPNEVQETLEDLAISDQPGSEINGQPELEPEPLQQVDPATPTSGDQSRHRKPNRQKARLARRAAEQEAQAAAAALEAENIPDLREQELASMKQQMSKLGLSETLIRPDGHCLFSACAHSMPLDILATKAAGNKKEPYERVRYAAAEFMAQHPEDFEAFMEEPLNAYVSKIRDTAEWGGELELQAIARSYNVEINVLQADGRVEKISSQSGPNDTIWLAYYRHSFGLGEHYNALRKVDKS